MSKDSLILIGILLSVFLIPIVVASIIGYVYLQQLAIQEEDFFAEHFGKHPTQADVDAGLQRLAKEIHDYRAIADDRTINITTAWAFARDVGTMRKDFSLFVKVANRKGLTAFDDCHRYLQRNEELGR
jgi:hypothetical protein